MNSVLNIEGEKVGLTIVYICKCALTYIQRAFGNQVRRFSPFIVR